MYFVLAELADSLDNSCLLPSVSTRKDDVLPASEQLRFYVDLLECL